MSWLESAWYVFGNLAFMIGTFVVIAAIAVPLWTVIINVPCAIRRLRRKIEKRRAQ